MFLLFCIKQKQLKNYLDAKTGYEILGSSYQTVNKWLEILIKCIFLSVSGDPIFS